MPHHIEFKAKDFKKQQVERMLVEKMIKLAHTVWAAPIVFPPKKDESLRFSVYHRKLNALTKRYLYPLWRMDECIYSLKNATVFSTLNVTSRY